MSGAQVADREGAAQIKVTVGQREVFIAQVGNKLERERRGMVQNIQLRNHYFDFSGWQFQVGGSFKAWSYFAGDSNNVLVMQSVSFLSGGGMVFRSKDDLGDAFPIAQVDADRSSVVPA